MRTRLNASDDEVIMETEAPVDHELALTYKSPRFIANDGTD